MQVVQNIFFQSLYLGTSWAKCRAALRYRNRQLKVKTKPPQEGEPVHGIKIQCQERLGETILEIITCSVSPFSHSQSMICVYVNV